MSVQIRGATDEYVAAIAGCLEQYQAAHPDAEIAVHRRNSASVRVRIIDPVFSGRPRAERDREVWPLLQQLPEDTFQEISMLLLVAPEEVQTSIGSREFDDPIPSRL